MFMIKLNLLQQHNRRKTLLYKLDFKNKGGCLSYLKKKEGITTFFFHLILILIFV